MLDQSYYRKADEIIEHYGRTAASLIPIMQDIQAEYRYLPGELLTYVAKEIGVKEAKAYSVATFYENFSFEPKGKYVIKVCDGTACPHTFRYNGHQTVFFTLYEIYFVTLRGHFHFPHGNAYIFL